MIIKADINGSMRSGVVKKYQAIHLSNACRARMANPDPADVLQARRIDGGSHFNF
jgi:hypothetical protein